MRDALNATDYPIWFALCGWSTVFATDPRGNNKIGNSARVGPDTGTGWTAGQSERAAQSESMAQSERARPWCT